MCDASNFVLGVALGQRVSKQLMCGVFSLPMIKFFLVQSPQLQSSSASSVLMAIAKGSSLTIPRIYTIATSSVGRD
ncbi:hypothetical protein CR513_38758, partial [Mucuna pruriens]